MLSISLMIPASIYHSERKPSLRLAEPQCHYGCIGHKQHLELYPEPRSHILTVSYHTTHEEEAPEWDNHNHSALTHWEGSDLAIATGTLLALREKACKLRQTQGLDPSQRLLLPPLAGRGGVRGTLLKCQITRSQKAASPDAQLLWWLPKYRGMWHQSKECFSQCFLFWVLSHTLMVWGAGCLNAIGGWMLK